MVSREKIAAEVTRVLDSPYFSSSPSLARTLTFCVDTALFGDHASLKETIIGPFVFRARSRLRYQAGSIVRVTIRRLRKKLESYYSDKGQDAGVRIHFPKGSYVPRFECIEGQILPEEKSPVPIHPEVFPIAVLADSAAFLEVARIR